MKMRLYLPQILPHASKQDYEESFFKNIIIFKVGVSYLGFIWAGRGGRFPQPLLFLTIKTVQ